MYPSIDATEFIVPFLKVKIKYHSEKNLFLAYNIGKYRKVTMETACK